MKLLKVFFFILFSISAQAQSFKVVYDRFEKNLITDENFSAEFKKKKLEAAKIPDKYILYYLDGNSFFKSLPTEVITHENAPVTIGETTTTFVEKAVKAPTKIYRSKGDEKFYSYREEDGKEYYKKSKQVFSSIDFKDETEKIDKFVCKLAEITFKPDGDIFKVWYTEDIPVTAGPFTYSDFPGLVLKVDSPFFVIYATNISTSVNEKDIEKINSKFAVQE